MKPDKEKNGVHLFAGLFMLSILVLVLFGVYQFWQLVIDSFNYLLYLFR